MATILGGLSRLNSGGPLIARAVRSQYRKSVRQRIKGEKYPQTFWQLRRRRYSQRATFFGGLQGFTQ